MANTYMKRYAYNGPVTKYGKCVATVWYGETMAVSEAKARSNLISQYKVANGLMQNTKIELTGKIIQMD